MTNSNAEPEISAEFPIKERYAFLNHAGVAPIPLSTQLAIREFAQDASEEGPVNYMSWVRGMGCARELAGRLLSCDADDVCFVKNTTHGMLIVANSIPWQPGDNIVGLAHEFPANVHPWRNLAEKGVEFRAVPERQDYTYAVEDIAARIDSRTRMLAVSWVEYSTGWRNDLDALGRLCRDRGVLFCVDAIQGLGVLPMHVDQYNIDFLTADGHKWLLAPEGCGVLYVRRARIAEMNRSMCGWCGLLQPGEYDNYDQQYRDTARRFEEGSHNLMAILALGASLDLLLDTGIARVAAKVKELTDQLIAGALQRGYRVVTPTDFTRRAGIVSMTKEGVDPAFTASRLLDEHRIVVAYRRGFLRASPHYYNDADEIDRLIAALP